MARYNTTELKQMSDPYQDLIADGSGLSENRDSLQALSLEEKIQLITLLVSSCASRLDRLERLSACNSAVPTGSQIDEEDFFRLITSALYIEQGIRKLSDRTHTSAHIFFVGMADVDPRTLTMCTADEKLALAIDRQPYMQFAHLTRILIEKDAQAIAGNLRECTPPEYIDIVFQVTKHTFPKSFVSALNNAFNNPHNEHLSFYDGYQRFGFMRALTQVTLSTADVSNCQIL